MDRIKEHFDANPEFYACGKGNPQVEEIWRQRMPMFAQIIDGRPAPFRMLDVGGGNGFFADRMLERFPQLEVTIVDISQSMLNENQPDPRKTLVCSDLQTYFQSLTDDTEYDLINFDVLLHHILTPQSFRESRRMQQDVLNQSATRLSSDGYLSIREIAYTSIAPLPRHATHKFLWFCTTRHLPGPARRMMHSMGMHSQGAGVCFFHADDLRQMLATSGLSISQWKTHQLARVGWKYHLALAGNATDLYIIAGRNAAPAN